MTQAERELLLVLARLATEELPPNSAEKAFVKLLIETVEKEEGTDG